MGKSGAGKDTLFKELLKDKTLGLKTIVPYTTRPIRQGEQEGVEYHFTDEAGYRSLLEQGRIIEEREYRTVCGLWRYFTVVKENLDLERESYCLIGTLEAYLRLRDYFGARRVLPVLIELEDGLRLKRALEREMSQKEPRYEELCRRFLADSRDFSPQNCRRAGIDRVFSNEDLDRCLKQITAYIKENQ